MNSLDIDRPPRDTRVVVAMSGGVDSSVTAALLHHEGYDVVGVTLQLYDHGAATHRKGACCAGQDIHDARRVCEALGVPHYVLDYESRFKEAVIDRFAQSYVAGETPVPCVECNRSVKFRDLMGMARDLGAHALATGHYVASRRLPEGGRAMFRARDADRDQSYFLFATTSDQLDFLRFPLGDLTKAQVRDEARRFGLTVAEKQDSQDICFVPSGRYAAVIEKLIPSAAAPGDIVDLSGHVVGRHPGIINFTVGQRRGLGLASGDPLYVVRLDAPANQVVVGPRDALRTTRLALRDVNWIGADIAAEVTPDRAQNDRAPNFSTQNSPSRNLFVKVRSTRAPQEALLSRNAEGGLEVVLPGGEDGVAPGQACVFYDGLDGQSRVLGGGFIASAEAARADAGNSANADAALPLRHAKAAAAR